MVKNKVLTPVLAGVLGLSLAALSFTIITVFIYKIIAKT